MHVNQQVLKQVQIQLKHYAKQEMIKQIKQDNNLKFKQQQTQILYHENKQKTDTIVKELMKIMQIQIEIMIVIGYIMIKNILILEKNLLVKSKHQKQVKLVKNQILQFFQVYIPEHQVYILLMHILINNANIIQRIWLEYQKIYKINIAIIVLLVRLENKLGISVQELLLIIFMKKELNIHLRLKFLIKINKQIIFNQEKKHINNITNSILNLVLQMMIIIIICKKILFLFIYFFN
ncbi:hypothetical protein IMG5_034820 [Ichthyophthirius multifiliis]|uniref:Transmembrane protein n=1 Tax=Ichthyophthirius multifiliis TaxID=5932 RepID=G0QLQ4_ICHMU|nr:hypothetical protein IMG5_034820 [Ichthyophthirius multifiliis]EGR33850.1 hypothetical protein IMG5_034820 [Ichthyophthirius multifiliis]|eukprot:XP_004039074.1 hypothetical protein IMG5_034820 [Ichthyophthirius multifiliis]